MTVPFPRIRHWARLVIVFVRISLFIFDGGTFWNSWGTIETRYDIWKEQMDVVYKLGRKSIRISYKKQNCSANVMHIILQLRIIEKKLIQINRVYISWVVNEKYITENKQKVCNKWKISSNTNNFWCGKPIWTIKILVYKIKSTTLCLIRFFFYCRSFPK